MVGHAEEFFNKWGLLAPNVVHTQEEYPSSLNLSRQSKSAGENILAPDIRIFHMYFSMNLE